MRARALALCALCLRRAGSRAGVVPQRLRLPRWCDLHRTTGRIGGAQRGLASTGDRVDFVVTLGPSATPGHSTGRLERQTARGTVAIRELTGASCQEVADALALNIELALQPAGSLAPSGPIAEPAPSAFAGMSVDVAEQRDAAAAPAKASGGTAGGLGVHMGAQATLTSGLAPTAAPGIALFVDVGVAGHASARATARGSHTASDARETTLSVWLVAGRLEGCPWSWSLGELWLAPCAGLDLGVLWAEGSGPQGTRPRLDSGLWMAGTGQLRARVRIIEALALEAEAGAQVPLKRYDFGLDASAATVFRTPAVGACAGLGIAWLLP